MKRLIGLAGLFASVVSFAATPPLNTNRAEVLDYFAENVYGVRPDFSDFKKTCSVADRGVDTRLKAHRYDVTLNTMTPFGETNFTAVALVPASAAGGRVPCFVYISFHDPAAMIQSDPPSSVHPYRWPAREIVGQGFATVAFDYQTVFPDETAAVKRWGASKDREPDGWGAISTWALAASRVMDWLEAFEGVDASKVAVIGLSRLGKTALWAGATDTRFAYVISNESGCLGARASTRRLDSPRAETIAVITGSFPHWFAPNCGRKFAGKDYDLPFDQHWLIATVAPRMMAVGSAEDDHWACPSAEHAGLDLARPAWGKCADRCHYFIRPGGHDIGIVDWSDYMSFAKRKGW